ncbi:MAG: tripartite tricarboxylate transporter TctB family protein [Betaproteobacteria bacterium]|nr:tripartite tricarboxylate transporter TctB family protein [Betaproteobacteria bacterium]
MAGILFISVGIAALVVGAGYPMGTATRMGAGYFPRLLSVILVVFGIAVALSGLRKPPVPATFARIVLRPAVAVTGAMLAFAALLSWAGLVPASIAVVVIGSLGNRDFRIGEVIVFALVLSAFAALLFVRGIGLTVDLF